ncbi:15321_t:CDS:1, partial [Dentiscutata heterogama]
EQDVRKDCENDIEDCNDAVGKDDFEDDAIEEEDYRDDIIVV